MTDRGRQRQTDRYRDGQMQTKTDRDRHEAQTETDRGRQGRTDRLMY